MFVTKCKYNSFLCVLRTSSYTIFCIPVPRHDSLRATACQSRCLLDVQWRNQACFDVAQKPSKKVGVSTASPKPLFRFAKLQVFKNLITMKKREQSSVLSPSFGFVKKTEDEAETTGNSFVACILRY